jgi:hypothetical protein
MQYFSNNAFCSVIRGISGGIMKIKKIAKEEKGSTNQFISSAAAEKVSAIMTVDYLKKRLNWGREKILKQY